jgi:hypothetical protein
MDLVRDAPSGIILLKFLEDSALTQFPTRRSLSPASTTRGAGMTAPGFLLTRTAFASSAASLLLASLPSAASAAETIKYTYDARGRLVEVERVQPTVTVKTKYTLDRVDNRTKKEITTTP